MSTYEKLGSRIAEDWFIDLKGETCRDRFESKTISADFITLNRDIGATETEKCGLAIKSADMPK